MSSIIHFSCLGARPRSAIGAFFVRCGEALAKTPSQMVEQRPGGPQSLTEEGKSGLTNAIRKNETKLRAFFTQNGVTQLPKRVLPVEQKTPEELKKDNKECHTVSNEV